MLRKQIFNRKYKWDQCNFWRLEVFLMGLSVSSMRSG